MSTSENTNGTRGGTAAAPFDPTRHLRRLNGRDYLDVQWRIMWFRTEHPNGTIRSEIVEHDREAGHCMAKAEVFWPEGGYSSNYGTETRADFTDYAEKACTKAIGRALAALGYGTQFTTDFETMDAKGSTHPVDSPVERPDTNPTDQAETTTTTRLWRSAPTNGSGANLATPAQLKLIYLTANRELHITEEQIEERCHAQYGRLPKHLTKREASELIDALKAGARGT